METRRSVDYAGLTDEQLALMARDGNERAVGELCVRYLNVATWAATRFARDRCDCNWVLVGAIERCVIRGRFDPSRGSLAPFLKKAIVNLARTEGRARLRRESRCESLPVDDRDGRFLADDDTCSAVMVECGRMQLLELASEWEGSRVRRAERCRWAAVLRLLLDGRSMNEIATTLGISAKSVRNIIGKRIRPAARARLGE